MGEIYFQEPRLKLSMFGEFFVRFITRSFYIVLIITGILLLLSDLRNLRWLGILIAFFLVDRLFHFGEGERALKELRDEKNNLARSVTPGAYQVLCHAFHKALITGENFHLL